VIAPSGLESAALLGDPPALIFDEPYNGMDPEGIVWMKGFLRSLATQQGRAVLVSSHLMSELEDTAGHLVIANRVTLRTTAPAEAMAVLASAGAEVAAAAPGVLTVTNLSSATTISILTSHAIPFSEVTTHRATLEQAYMDLTRESVEYRGAAS
jgi:ABC-2 type transport system ATP-binding protein